MNRRRFLTLCGAGAAGLSLPARQLAATLPPMASLDGEFLVERWSWAMGQPVRLVCFAATEDAGLEAAQAAFAILRSVEKRLTRFDSASDLAELNQRAGGPAFRAHPEFVAALRLAERFRRLTGGDFNAGVAPLLAAWGFYEPRAAAPGKIEIHAAREAVRHCRIEIAGSRVRLPTTDSRLDFGGLGVGIGLDRAMASIASRGIHRAMLEVSGDIVALGSPPGEPAWVVDIADSARPGTIVDQVKLWNGALATSANTVAVVRYGALVRGHVMDPADREQGAGRREQVTVVTDTAVEADALSTAMLVGGRAWPGVRRSIRL